MENKYYTPQIEEFHVGFECEWQCKITNENWHIEICDADLINIAWDAYEHSDYEEPYEEQFRVKYLDKEDISECGWLDEKEGHFGYTIYSINKYELHFFDATPTFIEIYNDDEKFQKFIGNIKNKSELQKLMKQLGL